jgi:hypothetical protein
MPRIRLCNHRLIQKLVVLHGSSEADIARACGYAGKASGRVNLNLFRKAITQAEMPILYDFAISISIADGPEGFLGPKDYVCLTYPNLENLYPENPLDPIVMTAYCRYNDPYPVVSFLLVKVPGSCPELESDPELLTEIGKISYLSSHSSMLSPKESEQMLGNVFSHITIASLKALSISTTTLIASLLAGGLVSNTRDIDGDISTSVEELLFHPAFHLLMRKGKESRIASYRPFYNDIWERDDAGNSFIPKDVLRRLSVAQNIKSIECWTSYPASGERISVSNWQDIINSLEDYAHSCVDDMVQSDSTLWRILAEIKEDA